MCIKLCRYNMYKLTPMGCICTRIRTRCFLCAQSTLGVSSFPPSLILDCYFIQSWPLSCSLLDLLDRGVNWRSLPRIMLPFGRGFAKVTPVICLPRPMAQYCMQRAQVTFAIMWVGLIKAQAASSPSWRILCSSSLRERSLSSLRRSSRASTRMATFLSGKRL